MKVLTRMVLGLFGLGVIALTLQFGVSQYGWNSPFGEASSVSAKVEKPDYVMSDRDPAFDQACGTNTINTGGGGFGVITDIEYNTLNSVAVVEGVARVAGQGRYGNLVYTSDMDKSQRLDATSTINTPFTISVSKTHIGPEKSVWNVSVPGGLVGCASYRQSADEARIFDGASGLFFISSGSVDWPGNGVSMMIATDGPEWFTLTEQKLGRIDEAVELLRTIK
ncbi:MAG: hypothetical protein O2921_09120 [Chloroflexi bacterium]|nr:hypothetical protein [Chloroflexota bacterium]